MNFDDIIHYDLKTVLYPLFFLISLFWPLPYSLNCVTQGKKEKEFKFNSVAKAIEGKREFDIAEQIVSYNPKYQFDMHLTFNILPAPSNYDSQQSTWSYMRKNKQIKNNDFFSWKQKSKDSQ